MVDSLAGHDSALSTRMCTQQDIANLPCSPPSNSRTLTFHFSYANHNQSVHDGGTASSGNTSSCVTLCQRVLGK